ncbi:RNA-binding protein 44 [Leptodactylus fuscus]
MCWKTQQQTIEKQSLFSLSKEPNKPSSSVTDFSISSALAEVEKKYQEMKAKIQSGTPLDRLTPLTMQLTTVETSADDFPKDLIGRQNVSDVPAEDLHKSKYMENINMVELRAIFLALTPPRTSRECPDEQLAFLQSGLDQGLSLSSLKGQESSSPPKKSLSFQPQDPKAAFLSSPDKCDQKPNEIQATPHGSEKPSHYYVHVGNIAHSVKEAGLRDVFQKYHVSNIFLEESSLSCCYAVLTFCKSEDVQAAIREVDGKMMHGKKLKVRAIKTSNCNLSLAFQNIKSVNKETTPDGKGYDSVGPKQSVMPVPPNSESTHPSQAWSAGTHAATVAGNWTNVNIPSSKCYTPTNTNQGIPAAPSCKSSNSSNFMAGGYQYMMQSHHSHMISYNSMPSYMCLPYSYPLYTLPNPPLYQSSVTYPNIIAPGINTNSNLYTQFSKDGGNIARAQPVKNIYRTDHQSKSGISRSLHNKVTSSNGNPKLSEKDTLAKFMEGKIPTLKCVNAPTFSFATSSNAKPVASENASLKVSVTTSQNDKPSASLLPTPETLAKQDRFSEPSPIKPTAPLRFPVFVPPSVTIPEANKPSENPNPSSEFVTPSENKTDTSSSATSRQNDSPGIMDWGVYPQLTSSEGPITVIPNKLNFSQFKRVMKFLMEKHKNATREQIVRALEDVRKTTGGSFGCMTIPEIIFATSTTLAGNIPPA